jgi:hypothetical protein
MTPWTFETLAAADRDKLEEVLRAGTAPQFDQLEGYTYRGWNHERRSRLTGEKFKKVFHKRDGRAFGYNQKVHQDGQGYSGEWRLKLKDGRPIQIGYYRVGLTRDEAPKGPYREYDHTGLLNYNLDLNTGFHLALRVIRDFVVMPSPGDHELILGKAYLQLGLPSLSIFYSYFVLGHREPTEHGSS